MLSFYLKSCMNRSTVDTFENLNLEIVLMFNLLRKKQLVIYTKVLL